MYSQKQRNLDLKRKLRYVKVYEDIYEKIKTGIYPLNSQLPGEMELAKEMNVSRMTLRQALAFLQDDGIIKTIKGKGNFVIFNPADWSKGLEIVSNPVQKCLMNKITGIELNYRIEPATKYTNEILGRDTGIVVFVDRWYLSEKKPVAYCFSTLPGDNIAKLGLDLNDNEALCDFLENKIYEQASHSEIQLEFSKMGNVHSVRYKISEADAFYLLQEKIYIDGEYPVIHNKFYMPINNAILNINATEKR